MGEEKDMPAISVIVPVYNAEDTLESCVRSIYRQSFKDMEIVLVDDGSTDQSWELCLRLAEEMDNVRPFRQENAGEGSARNFGVRVARGTYVMFADDDDLLPPDAARVLFEAIVGSGAELAMGDYIRTWDGSQIHRRLLAEHDLLTLSDYLMAQARSARPLDFYYLVVWNKIFRKDVIVRNDILMRPRVILNDFGFVLDYLEHVRTIAIVHDPVYLYAYRASSGLQKFKRLDALEKWRRYAWIFARFDGFAKERLTPAEYAVFKRNITHRLFGGGVPNITVIVPVSRSEATIRACMESILGQSYLNLELIVADGGSRDKSMQIAGEFAARDRRVRILPYPCKGLSTAKNAALGEMRGRHVLFVYPDMVLEEGALETLSRVAAESEAELVAWEGSCGDGSSVVWDVVDSAAFAERCRAQGDLGRLDAMGKLFQRRAIEAEELWFDPRQEEGDGEFCQRYLGLIAHVAWGTGKGAS